VVGGILLGTALAAPVAGAALMAQVSSQKIVIDGKPAQIEAYSINGNNYAKLRDIGKAVGFHVSYDAASNTVVISTTEPYAADTPVRASRTVVLPTDGSQYVPKVGDRILCNDGTEYEIKDVARWNSSPLPTPTCGWNAFQTLTLPEPIVKHYSDKYGDDLFVRNVYEVRRMVYTIYNALGSESNAWRDGNPPATVETVIPPEYEAYTTKFWPWNECNLTDLVHSRPSSRYYVDAYDYYHNNVYMYTRYCFMSI
ncbi:MAG: hypothetical protein J6M06_02055, partial [Synergistaceae bacterium]|nr:hypothetical protein [Synergistaceae bacterium]